MLQGVFKLGLFLIILFVSPFPVLFNTATEHSQRPNIDVRGKSIAELGRGTAVDIATHPSENMFALGGSAGVWIYSFQFEDIAHFAEKFDVKDVSWSPNGNYVGATTSKKSVQVWDVQSQQLVYEGLQEPTETTFSNMLDWSQDSEWIAFSQNRLEGQEIKILNLTTGDQFSLHTDNVVTKIRWHRQRNIFAFMTLSSTITIWDLDSQSVIESFDYPSRIEDINWSPNGKLLALTRDEANSIRLWRPEENELEWEIAADFAIFNFVWSPNLEYLAASNENGEIVLFSFNVEGKPVLETLDRLEYWNTLIAWDYNGTQLITVGLDNNIKIWNVPERRILGEFNSDHTWPVVDLAWRPFSNQVASIERLEQLVAVKIWDIESETVIYSHFASIHADTNDLRWSPDGSKLMVSFFSNYPLQTAFLMWDFSKQPLSLVTQPISLDWERTILSAQWNENGDTIYVVSRTDFNPRCVGELDIESLELHQLSCSEDDLMYVFDHDQDSLVLIYSDALVVANKDDLSTRKSMSLRQLVLTPGYMPDIRDEYVGLIDDSIAGDSIQIVNLSTSEITAFNTGYDRVSAIRLHPHLDLIAIGGECERAVIFLWFHTTEFSTVDHYPGCVEALGWSTEGDYLAVDSGNGIVEVSEFNATD